jgi:hypothetical protein
MLSAASLPKIVAKKTHQLSDSQPTKIPNNWKITNRASPKWREGNIGCRKNRARDLIVKQKYVPLYGEY